MFHWRRVVVDEFTYASPTERVVLQNFQAHFRWFLSATPSIEKFEDVRAIAKYMGVNLGRPDAESSKVSEGLHRPTPLVRSLNPYHVEPTIP